MRCLLSGHLKWVDQKIETCTGKLISGADFQARGCMIEERPSRGSTQGAFL